MSRKIYAIFVAIIGIIAALTTISTLVYVMFFGLSGDGTRETGFALTGFMVALWCGLRVPGILYPEESEDVPSFLDKWTPF